ncbi:hypothetical protein QN277_020276 [Acacia crassicarpa]|uniref:Uncharacterized protein n=1 Tax=Acacia crassicarpa TaxID=499986 RepID=A0AAE1JJ66_9FABA|nr:hypothetical protein QN277_020276 [Acacia crassicarpa]
MRLAFSQTLMPWRGLSSHFEGKLNLKWMPPLEFITLKMKKMEAMARKREGRRDVEEEVDVTELITELTILC